MDLPSDAVDFPIVGSGAAGCALASRLREDAGARVRLAEVGRDVTPVNIPPLLASAYPGRTYFELEWLAKHTLAPGAGDCFAALAMTVGGKSRWELAGSCNDS